MPKPPPLEVDLNEAESFLQIFPRSPLQMSDSTVWRGIFLAHHRQPAWEMPENRLSQHILSINIGAARNVERSIDGRLQHARFLTGHVAIYPSDTDYTLRWERESEFLLLGLDPSLLSQTATALLGTETVELTPLLSTQDALIHGMAWALKDELEASQASGRMYAESIAQTLSIHLLRNYSVHQQPLKALTTSGLPKQKLHQVMNYIHDFLDRDLSVTELAALVQISPFHFARLFKQSTGVAPYQFVIQCRVQRAKELLLQGERTIADVATDVGFANQSHLNRHFKRIVGVTPKVVLDHSQV